MRSVAYEHSRHEADRRLTRTVALFAAIMAVAVLAALYVVPNASAMPKHHGPLAHAAFYNHLDVCESTLRGYSSDDDIHNFGVATGAKSFGGWGAYGHNADNSVWVYGRFNYTGSYEWVKGNCYGGDYASDWFSGF